MAVAFWIAAVVLFLALRWWINRQLDRPLTETDKRCSRVDVELDELRAEGSVRHYVGGGWRV
jgi:hypothetical protein